MQKETFCISQENVPKFLSLTKNLKLYITLENMCNLKTVSLLNLFGNAYKKRFFFKD